MAVAEPSLPRSQAEAPDPRWPAEGEWTYADYQRLPDDGRRYEVIRGNLYVTPAPIYAHQYASIQLSSRLLRHVTEEDLGTVVTAPFDVILPGIASPVQPDLIYFRKDNQPRPDDRRFEGTPDLVIEILSPSTSRRDLHVKLGAYEDAGVPEYWIVDPKSRSVTVFALPEGGTEYEEIGRHVAGETVGSRVLEGLELGLDGVFP